MHWVGKVSAWLLVLLVLAASVFTSKLVLVRNGWLSKSEKLKKDYAALVSDLRENQAKLERLKHDWHRATQVWGVYALAPTTVQDPAVGSISVDLGSKDGIRQGQWLYGFETLPDGTTVYRGDFIVEAVREGQSLLQPNWRIRTGDTQGWQNGQWRWRVQLPSAYPGRFEELEQALVRQDELLNDRQQTLAVQNRLIETAREQLELREQELVGGPQLPQTPTLDPEHRQGLMTALEDLEEARNHELVAIDQLRRSVRLLHRRIEDLESENRTLVGKLPQPSTEVTQQP